MVIGRAEFDVVIAARLPIECELAAIHPFIAALDLGDGIVREIEGARFDGERPRSRNHSEIPVHVGLELSGGTVEINVLVPNEISEEPRVGEPPNPKVSAFEGLILQERAINKKIVLIECRTKVLIGGDRIGSVAAGEANAGGEFVGDVDVESEPQPDTRAFPIFCCINEWRQNSGGVL